MWTFEEGILINYQGGIFEWVNIPLLNFRLKKPATASPRIVPRQYRQKTIPPCYPAPSPHGNNPLILTCCKVPYSYDSYGCKVRVTVSTRQSLLLHCQRNRDCIVRIAGILCLSRSVNERWQSRSVGEKMINSWSNTSFPVDHNQLLACKVLHASCARCPPRKSVVAYCLRCPSQLYSNASWKYINDLSGELRVERWELAALSCCIANSPLTHSQFSTQSNSNLRP